MVIARHKAAGSVVGLGELPQRGGLRGPAVSVDDVGLLFGWLQSTQTRQNVRGSPLPAVAGALPFAFYGRISPRDYQAAPSSRAWQLDSGRQTIAGRALSR